MTETNCVLVFINNNNPLIYRTTHLPTAASRHTGGAHAKPASVVQHSKYNSILLTQVTQYGEVINLAG